jgi:anti-sigma factor RsiW
MSCEKIETSLIAYLDGRASEKEAVEVNVHLSSCAACRARAEQFRRLWSVLDGLPAGAPSPEFDARLRARIAAEPRPPLWSWLVPQPRLALAVVALLVLSAWIASKPPAASQNPPVLARSEEDFRMIKDLRVLENYEVLANFEALSELPSAQPAQQQPETN